MNDEDLKREAFEKWHKSEYQGYNSYNYNHDTTAYIDDFVEMAWIGWQAAMVSQHSEYEAMKKDAEKWRGVSFPIEQAIKNGCCPFDIEDAYENVTMENP